MTFADVCLLLTVLFAFGTLIIEVIKAARR